LSEERLKIAVFIDFDNIAIGVKQSLSRNFDIGTVLEAIKERGEVVTKIAYGDWKRAEDYSRAMTQHAVQMVQRNLTPGGDKNGADIALALDAIEMAFTRNHINAFVIVGGDSDFIALVEKLKQYDKMVFVVGGRAFTSAILQKNCHEFIAYENLIGAQSGTRKVHGKTPATSRAQLKNAIPLMRRALKVLSDREVSPQLGLLKSTLLQLDSTFSERDYGAGSFREFVQKFADAGYVNLKQVDRSLIVELKESEPEVPHVPPPVVPATPAKAPEPAETVAISTETAKPPLQTSEAIRALLEWFQNSAAKLHWPLYLRSLKQSLHSSQPAFDERQYGVTSIYDLVRLAQKESIFHVERNRQGILRIFPGERFPQAAAGKPQEEGALVLEQPPAQALSVESGAETQPAPETPPEPLIEGLHSNQETFLPESEEVAGKTKRRRKTLAGAGGAKKVRGGVRKSRSAKKTVSEG
jgi:uncharacterized LabA/DUF88 family protein